MTRNIEGLPMTFSIHFQKTGKKTADTTVVGIFEGQKLSKSAKQLNKETSGLIEAGIDGNAKFTGKSGQTLNLGGYKDQYKRVIVLGLGKKEDLNNITIENLGGKLFKALQSLDVKNVDIHVEGIEDIAETSTPEIASHLAYGFKLKSYTFEKYQAAKKKAEKASLKSVTIVTDAHTASKKYHEILDAISEGVFLARDLVNEPPNMLHPESYAELIKKELKPLGVEVEVLDEKKMQKLGFGALLAVGQGSIRESKTVIMRWNGNKKISKKGKNPIAFVGKGVTFDTGGISLKPGAGMDQMKMDMGGSAAVVGLMKALAGRKAKASVIGIVGLVENMPSDRAYRPGDIITSHSGKTIEVLNTDAEGRLVLADAMTYVQETYKPEVIIDLATLTGAMMVSLGYEYCGSFVNDDALWDQMKDASDNTGEKLWRMPLDKAFREQVKSDVADIKNLATYGQYGGACTAAAFIENFVKDGVKWAHMDIAGTAWWKAEGDVTPKGGTGFPVRALNDLVKNHYEKK